MQLIITAILALINVIPIWFKFKLPSEGVAGKPITAPVATTSAED